MLMTYSLREENTSAVPSARGGESPWQETPAAEDECAMDVVSEEAAAVIQINPAHDQ